MGAEIGANIPVPANVLVTFFVAVLIVSYGALRVRANRAPIRIRVTGTSRCGKTTWVSNIKTPGDYVAPMESTTHIQPPFNTKYIMDVGKKEETTRRLNLRDVTGQGWLRGEWHHVMVADSPHAVVHIIDQRAVQSMRLGGGAENQYAAMEYLVAVLTGVDVLPEMRPKVFMLAVNKSDVWEEHGTSEQELLTPFLPLLGVLRSYGITVKTCRMQANNWTMMESMLRIVLEEVEKLRHPWNDWQNYVRSGLRSEVIAAERQIKRLSKPPRSGLWAP